MSEEVDEQRLFTLLLEYDRFLIQLLAQFLFDVSQLIDFFQFLSQDFIDFLQQAIGTFQLFKERQGLLIDFLQDSFASLERSPSILLRYCSPVSTADLDEDIHLESLGRVLAALRSLSFPLRSTLVGRPRRAPVSQMVLEQCNSHFETIDDELLLLNDVFVVEASPSEISTEQGQIRFDPRIQGNVFQAAFQR